MYVAHVVCVCDPVLGFDTCVSVYVCGVVVTVYLVESIDADHDELKHLKALVFCRPTAANFERLKKIVANPKFGQYNLCTSPWRVV